MTLIETLRLPAPAPQLWELLVEQQGALRLTPGMALGGAGRGTFRVVLEGHSLTYRGYARQHVEEPGRHVTWTLSGKEVRGTGRAHVEVRARFKPGPDGGTLLRLTVLVEGRGRLAQSPGAELDRSVHSVLLRFRRAVARELEPSAPPAAAAEPERPAAAREEPAPAVPAPEAAPSPGPQPRGRVEILPPIRERGGRGMLPAVLAGGALALGIGVLVYRRLRGR